MMRIAAWLSLLAMMLPGSLAYAQSPYGNRGVYGYPPPMPASSGPSEPYFVPRDEPAPREMAPTTQSIEQVGRRAAARREAVCEPAPVFDACPPAEPYTLYEGKRYLAEEKQDCTHIWGQASYIHWWIRRDSTPPLLTTGDPNNPRAGTLGFADTVTLLGNGPIAPNQFNGIETSLGMWLDDERLQSLEVGGFWVGKLSRNYRFASDGTGSPVLAQPVLVGGVEQSLQLAAPTLYAGNFVVNASTEFYGAELNFARNTFRYNHWTLDLFGGLRYLYLSDALSINQTLNVLDAGTGFVPFNGTPQPSGSTFLFNDSFAVTNRFYGGQLGARVNFAFCNFDLGAVAKLGMGATTHTVYIDGSTTLNDINGNSTTLRGSTLAQASNIGRFTSNDFSFVPELIATAGYQLTPHLRLMVAYNLLYWTRVERAGNQIDRNIDFTQVPTSPTFVPGSFGTRPLFPNTRTDFWASGINVGVELRY